MELKDGVEKLSKADFNNEKERAVKQESQSRRNILVSYGVPKSSAKTELAPLYSFFGEKPDDGRDK